jgi:hypothetical protein
MGLGQYLPAFAVLIGRFEGSNNSIAARAVGLSRARHAAAYLQSSRQPDRIECSA